jgi:pimeloyl-ACP methyl ester carboxylesterase
MADTARGAGWSVESLDYQGIADPRQRARRLEEWCGGLGAPAVLVGSSMGGFVALSAAARVGARGLFLLAPALYLPGFQEHLPAAPACPTVIVHGWRDEVVPWQGSLRYAEDARARLLMLDGDHRLTACIDLICRELSGFLDELAPARGGG